MKRIVTWFALMVLLLAGCSAGNGQDAPPQDGSGEASQGTGLEGEADSGVIPEAAPSPEGGETLVITPPEFAAMLAGQLEPGMPVEDVIPLALTEPVEVLGASGEPVLRYDVLHADGYEFDEETDRLDLDGMLAGQVTLVLFVTPVDGEDVVERFSICYYDVNSGDVTLIDSDGGVRVMYAAGD